MNKAIYEYRPEYATMLLEYFDVDPTNRVDITDKEGNVVDVKFFATEPPTFYGFAKMLGIPSKAIKAWCVDNPEFQEAWDRAEDCLKHLIFVNGITGKFDKTVVIFAMKNMFGWTDRVEQKLEIGAGLTSFLNKISEHNNQVDMLGQRQAGTQLLSHPSQQSKNIMFSAKSAIEPSIIEDMSNDKIL